MDVSPCAVRYSCRKCRQHLEVTSSVIHVIEGCSLQNATQSSMLFLDFDSCPEWIVCEVECLQWTKGKLHCQKCHGRLGSFDFMTVKNCSCGRHELPPLHLLRNRVDVLQTHRDTPEKTSATNPTQPCSQASSCYQGLLPSTKLFTGSCSYTDMKTEVPKEDSGGLRKLVDSRMDSRVETIEVISTKKREYEDRLDENNYVTGTCPAHSGQSQYDQACAESSAVYTTRKRLSKRDLRRQRMNSRKDANHNPFFALQELDLVEEPPDPLPCISDDDVDTGCTTDNAEDEQVLEDIPDDWVCCVCMELYHLPTTCRPCGHRYCDPCLRLLNKTTHLKPVLCPLCRKVIQECLPEKELKSRIEDAYPDAVKARQQRVRSLGLKTAPLPTFSRSQQYQSRPQLNGAFLVIDRLVQAANLTCYFKRFLLLLILYICHNVLFIISENIVSLPYTSDRNGFNGFLWLTFVLLLKVYILKCIPGLFQPVFNFLRRFRGFVFLYVFFWSESMIRVAVTSAVLLTIL